jgi:hypothetical protein
MTNAAERAGHAADAGVIVGQRAQGGPDELYEVRMVWEEGGLPERSERFSAGRIMAHVTLSGTCGWSPTMAAMAVIVISMHWVRVCRSANASRRGHDVPQVRQTAAVQ